MQKDYLRHKHRGDQRDCEFMHSIFIQLSYAEKYILMIEQLPDVVCVIDSGRVREVRRNKRTSSSMLVTDWCPRSSAKQRQGRAGRVQPGICECMCDTAFRLATDIPTNSSNKYFQVLNCTPRRQLKAS